MFAEKITDANGKLNMPLGRLRAHSVGYFTFYIKAFMMQVSIFFLSGAAKEFKPNSTATEEISKVK